MKSPLSTSDFASNAAEQIEHVAKLIGRSAHKRAVFEAVYYHKAKARTVDEIARKTGLTRIQVLKVGSALAGTAFDQIDDHNGDIAYARRREYHKYKKQILALGGSREKQAKWPTKRKVIVNFPKSVAIPSAGANVKRVYIDNFAAFAKVKKVKKGADSLPPEVSEDQFKSGVQAIIGEPGQFKDWGGERSDLYTTRLHLNGKRLSAAFAFKGPGLKGKLVLGKMGKNGDQLPRLLQEEADVFFVQHWREIDPLVIETMRNLVVAKSVTTGKPLWFGTIDGRDSHRLYRAYPAEFTPKVAKKKRKGRGG